MIFADKKVGETPLELINRLRIERLELKDKKLSYAGRLDPMAEGEMLVLVGDEENKNRKKYLGLDKEYEAEFLVGVSTDTGDVLGKITKIQIPNPKIQINLESQILDLKNLKEQKYPWFSSRTVRGKPLFEYYKEGKLDIERPIRKVEIKDVELIKKSTKTREEIQKYIFDSIKKVKGDFRQEEILERWHVAFGDAPNELQTFKIKVFVSSGTYIRALTEEFDFSLCVLKLNRTKIFNTFYSHN